MRHALGGRPRKSERFVEFGEQTYIDSHFRPSLSLEAHAETVNAGGRVQPRGAASFFGGPPVRFTGLPHPADCRIQDAPHDSMNARPEAFNKGLIEYLDNLEHGKPVAGRRVL